MGQGQSLTPSTVNTCTDIDDLESTNVPIKNFCYTTETSSYNDDYCSYYGGTYPNGSPPTSNTYSFPESEWINSQNPNPDSCYFNSFNEPSEIVSSDPGLDINASSGRRGYCTRVKNTGDPLICALKDFQCNGANEISNPACFSDNKLNNTCSKDFRAPDTLPSNFLINQFCLGNIPNSIENLGSTGFEFYQLWTDSSNLTIGNQSVPWVITNTPQGTVYRTGFDIELQQGCQYDSGGIPSNCPISIWQQGNTGSTGINVIPAPGAPTIYAPQPDTYQFAAGQPPCQQLFWRTLYGNQPTFKNNFFSPFGNVATCPDGSSICENTSVPPQQAACGAIPFGGEPTDVGFTNAQFLLESAVKKYISNGGNMTDELAIGGSPEFQSWVYQICQTYPGICNNLLKNTICSNITEEELLLDPYKLQWCGCYLEPNSYKQYENIGVSQECTPFCNRPNVIPLVDIDTNLPKYCQQSVCIIDDVTITLARTNFENKGIGGGNLNFNQICNSCSASGNNGTNTNTLTSDNSLNASTTSEGVVNNNASINCQCILKNFTLTTVGSTIEGGINISQACNGNAKCYSSGSNTNGDLAEVDCHGSSTGQNNTIAKAEAALLKKARNTSNYWVIFFIILLIGLIIIAWLMIAPRGVPEKDIIINKRFDIPEPISPPVNYYQPVVYNRNFGNFTKPKSKFY